VNLGDIRTAASIELGIRADTAGEKQTMVDRLANAAVLEILKRTKIRVTSATVSTTIGVGDYDIPMEVIRLTSLEAPVLGGSGYGPVDPVDPDEIRWRRRSPLSVSTDLCARYAVDGFNLLMLDPIPQTIYLLVMYYVPRPAKMTVPADDPSTIAFGGIPEEFHETVLLPFVYWKAGSAGDDASSAQGVRYQQDFELGLRELRIRINRRRGPLGPARTMFNRHRRRRWATDQA
jgi:hypothetical protein